MSTKTMIEKLGGKPVLFLGSLPDGAIFELVGMEKQYRSLRVERSTTGGTYISGAKRTDDGWKPLPSPYQISNGSQVRLCDAAATEEEEPMPKEEASEKNPAPEPEAQPEPKKEKAPKSEEQPLDFVIPDGEFTVKSFCESSGAPLPKAHIFIKDKLASGEIISLGTRPTGGRGKPPVWFKKA